MRELVVIIITHVFAVVQMNRLLVICVALTVCATYLSGVAGITCYRKIANEDPVQEV